MSRYLYALHNSDGAFDRELAGILKAAGVPTWLVITVALGLEGTVPRHDFTPWLANNITPIVRVNHGYGSAGTVPLREHYSRFAERVVEYAVKAKGLQRVILGNEPNCSRERPGGKLISAMDYADLFVMTHDLMEAFAPEVELITAAVGPWNVESGDWYQYQHAFLKEIGPQRLEGIALHTYSRGPSPGSITSDDKMDAPFENFYNGFRAYRDLIKWIPIELIGKPLYITETDQNEPWHDAPGGIWCQTAYAEINDYNLSHGSWPIRCLALYRWDHDEYALRNKPNVLVDFFKAADERYAWREEQGNMGLENPSLEAPYVEQGRPETYVARKWTHYFGRRSPVPGTPQDDCAEPETREANIELDARRVRSGESAQKMFVRWRLMHAGIYQRVTGLPQGSKVRFSAWGQAWCSDEDDPTISDGEMYFRVGVDPKGGVDPFCGDIAWQDWQLVRADYAQISMDARIEGTAATVFVEAGNKYALSHNDAYIDDCKLEVLEVPGPGPGPTPGTIIDKLTQARDLIDEVIPLLTQADELAEQLADCL